MSDETLSVVLDAILESLPEATVKERLSKYLSNKQQPPAKKQKLPVVAIMGAKPDQFQRIQHEVGDLFNLRYIDKNRENRYDLGTGVDMVAATGFISHAMSNKAKQLNVRVSIYHGGIGALINGLKSSFYS